MKISTYMIKPQSSINPENIVNQQSGNKNKLVDPGSVPKENPSNLDALKSIYSDKELKKLGFMECQACAERRYVDGSDDPSVSFKTPTQIDPEQSASMVMSHEMEHVANEQANADRDGREVVSQSVRLHSSICPE